MHSTNLDVNEKHDFFNNLINQCYVGYWISDSEDFNQSKNQEPSLLKLCGKISSNQLTNKTKDIAAREFWERDQKAFFDVIQ